METEGAEREEVWKKLIGQGRLNGSIWRYTVDLGSSATSSVVLAEMHIPGKEPYVDLAIGNQQSYFVKHFNFLGRDPERVSYGDVKHMVVHGVLELIAEGPGHSTDAAVDEMVEGSGQVV